MKIETTRFGEIVIEENNIIEFNSGLLAFEDLSRFILLDIAENSNFKWLQSVDNPDITFLLVDPFVIRSDYYVDVNEEVKEILGIRFPEDVLIYTTVTVPPSGLKDATTNLVGPLVFNWRKKTARQIICDDKNNIIKYPLWTIDSQR